MHGLVAGKVSLLVTRRALLLLPLFAGAVLMVLSELRVRCAIKSTENSLDHNIYAANSVISADHLTAKISRRWDAGTCLPWVGLTLM